MAVRTDHSRLIHDCLRQNRQAIVTTRTIFFHMVAQRYSKRVNLPFSPTESDIIYCVWQDESGHRYDHIDIEQLQFVRALWSTDVQSFWSAKSPWYGLRNSQRWTKIMETYIYDGPKWPGNWRTDAWHIAKRVNRILYCLHQLVKRHPWSQSKKEPAPGYHRYPTLSKWLYRSSPGGGGKAGESLRWPKHPRSTL